MRQHGARAIVWVIAFAIVCLCLELDCFPTTAQIESLVSGTIDRTDHFQDHRAPVEYVQPADLRTQERAGTTKESVLAAVTNYLAEDASAPFLGNPKGDVTIVEFFDYLSPGCRRMEPVLQTLLKKDAGVRIVQRQYPIGGAASFFVARVALAAHIQKKHPQFHAAMMKQDASIGQAAVLRVAERAGLDIGRINADMYSAEVESEIERNFRIAAIIRVSAVPTFIVAVGVASGVTDLNTLRTMIYDARKQHQ